MKQLPFFWRFYLGYVLLILGAALVTSVVGSHFIATQSRENTRAELLEKALLLGEISKTRLLGENTGLSSEPLFRIDTKTRYTLIGVDGTVLADSRKDPKTMDRHDRRAEVLEAKSAGTGSSVRLSATTGEELMYVASRIQDGDALLGYARASVSLQSIDERISRLRRATVLAALAALFLALPLGFFVGKRITAPVTTMAEAVRQFGDEHYGRRIRVQSHDEFGDLAQAFNGMAENLQERIDEMGRNSDKLLAILSGMVEGVIAVDQEERIIHMNDAAGRILSSDKTGALKRPFWEVTRSVEISQTVTDTMGGGRSVFREVTLPQTSGDLVLELYGSPLRASDGSRAGAVLVLHDVTKLRQLQLVRRDFVANASHELKTPIAVIRGMVETLLEDEDVPLETQRRFLGRIRAQSHRLSTLISDLLALSRLEAESETESHNHQATNLGAVIRGTYTAFQTAAETKGLTLLHNLPQEPVRIAGDPTDLRQILDNLVDNAIKYTPDKGSVTITLTTNHEFATVEVADSGVGIEPKHLDRIFERFYRVDAARSRELGGTGLGLAIVKHTCQLLGGQIEVLSTPGVGTTFKMNLPVVPTPTP